MSELNLSIYFLDKVRFDNFLFFILCVCGRGWEGEFLTTALLAYTIKPHTGCQRSSSHFAVEIRGLHRQ